MSAIVSIISAVAYMFFPGVGTAASLNWNNSLANILAPAVNYYPQELLIKGNCHDLSNLPAGRLFTTVPATETGAMHNEDTRIAISQALTIDKTVTSEIVVSSWGRIILDVDTNSCQDFQLLLKQHSITTSIDNHQTSVAKNALPMFLGFFAITPSPLKSLSLSVIINNRFAQHPSTWKICLGFITLLSVIITAVLLTRSTPGYPELKTQSRSSSEPEDRTEIPLTFLHLPCLPRIRWTRFIDIIVLIVLGVWHFIGANTADDGYILTMVKERTSSGYDPNYFRWFGAGESPFGWFYAIYHWLDAISPASIWLRLPELVCGMVTWLILFHGVLPRLRTVLGLSIPSRVSHITTMCCFLLFWCTFNNGLRPEGIIACGFAVVIWLALLALQSHQPVIFYLCGICAGYTLTSGPTAIILFAPIAWLLLVGNSCLDPFFHSLAVCKPSVKIVIVCCLVISAGAATIPVAFYFLDFTTFLHKALMQIRVGPDFPWFEEQLRYNLLLSYSPDGAMPRRIAIFGTFLALIYLGLYAGQLSLEHHFTRLSLAKDSSPVQRVRSSLDNAVPDSTVLDSTVLDSTVELQPPVNSSIRKDTDTIYISPQAAGLAKFILICLGSFALLSFTPTKPTHHFGAFVVIGTMAVACATTLPAARLLNTFYKKNLWLILTLSLTALAYTGPNSYWFVSGANILWSNFPIRVGISLGTIFILIAGLIVAITLLSAFYQQFSARKIPDHIAARDEMRHSIEIIPEVTTETGNFDSFDEFDLSASSVISRGSATIWHFLSRRYIDIIHFFSLRMLSSIFVVTLVIEFSSFGIPAVATFFDMRNAPYSVAKGNFRDLSGNAANLASEIYTESPYERGLLHPIDPTDPENIGKNYKKYSPAHVPPALMTENQEETVAELSNSTQSLRLDAYNSGTMGVSYHLPFGLPKNTPYTGNYISQSRAGMKNPAAIMSTDTDLVTGWYVLPKVTEHRLLILSVAGNASISAEFTNHLTGKSIAIRHFIDPYPGEKWRNIFINLHTIPFNPKYIRIIVEPINPRSWIVLSAPRAPHIITLEELLKRDPVLTDWVVGLGFPTLHPFTIANGIQQAPKWRITPDRKLLADASNWEDSYSGGPLGLIAGYARVIDWPTYMLHPLGGHYIALERYVSDLPYQPAHPRLESVRE